MKNEKTPFELRKGVGIAISIGFGAAMGLIINGIGENIGEYHGRKKSNEDWEAALDKMFKQSSKNESEEE